MATDNNAPKISDTRLDWVEPAVTTLKLSETAMNPSPGADGNPYVDCSRS